MLPTASAPPPTTPALAAVAAASEAAALVREATEAMRPVLDVVRAGMAAQFRNDHNSALGIEAIWVSRRTGAATVRAGYPDLDSFSVDLHYYRAHPDLGGPAVSLRVSSADMGAVYPLDRLGAASEEIERLLVEHTNPGLTGVARAVHAQGGQGAPARAAAESFRALAERVATLYGASHDAVVKGAVEHVTGGRPL